MHWDTVSLRLQRQDCSAKLTLPPTEVQLTRSRETQQLSRPTLHFHSSNRSTRGKENPTFHKVKKLGCHERHFHKGFFMDGSSSPAGE